VAEIPGKADVHEAGWIRPNNEKAEVAARELIALVEARLPQRFYGGERYWRFYGAAMIVRMADTVEATISLMHADLAIDGLILLRALYEQVVGYLWIAINPEENLGRWLEGARWHERKMHDDALEYDMSILTDEELASTAGARKLKDLAQRAKEVDEHWGGRLIGFRESAGGRDGILTMRGLYVAIYRFASRAAHGQPHALDAYANAESYPRRVTRPSDQSESIWWSLCVPLYAHALLVCHDQLGWPDRDRVIAINDAMYT
jgi:hypothetical protein